jgi:hypothetical protein
MLPARKTVAATAVQSTKTEPMAMNATPSPSPTPGSKVFEGPAAAFHASARVL